jgi:hypothetical protein
MHPAPGDGPLIGYEMSHLRLGHVLLRRTSRYPIVMMWLCRNNQPS